MTDSISEHPDGYSPHLRTAVLFTGTGTAGAYHAGVLRALQEAGIKIDVVAGCGMGAATALFAAIDASAQLSEASSFWRSPAPSHLYGFRPFLRFLALALALSLLSVLVPLVAVVAAAVVFPVAYFLGMAGVGAGAASAQKFVSGLYGAFEPGALPSILPRVAVIGLLVAVAGLLVEAWRTRRASVRRTERGWIWAPVAAPFEVRSVVAEWRARLWRALAGGPVGKQPKDRDLSARYTELLAENLGQPGFREVLLLVHDLDARRDVVFALLAERLRRDFFASRGRVGAPAMPAGTALPRSAEAFDLSGLARDRLIDVLQAALRLPFATDPHAFTYAADGYWRGETHRLTHRPDAIARLIEEAGEAGATQIVIVSAAPEPPGPHASRVRFMDLRSRLGEYITSAEGAATRDAVRAALDVSRQVFHIRPEYNPLGALDFRGQYDNLSDRHHTVAELVERGYEDAYRQFIDPVVGAGGEHLDART